MQSQPGAVIKLNGAPYKVTRIQQGRRGKGGGFVKAKLENVLTGIGTERTFTSDEIVEEIALQRIKAQYSWTNEDTLMFMNAETFEEICVPQSCVETHAFLVEGDEYMVTVTEPMMYIYMPIVSNTVLSSPNDNTSIIFIHIIANGYYDIYSPYYLLSWSLYNRSGAVV